MILVWDNGKDYGEHLVTWIDVGDLARTPEGRAAVVALVREVDDDKKAYPVALVELVDHFHFKSDGTDTSVSLLDYTSVSLLDCVKGSARLEVVPLVAALGPAFTRQVRDAWAEDHRRWLSYPATAGTPGDHRRAAALKALDDALRVFWLPAEVTS